MKNTSDPNVRAMERGPVPATLKRFIWDIQSLVELAESEREILIIGRDLMARLIENDDWLPAVSPSRTPWEASSFRFIAMGSSASPS
jgi:hypothetical protein